MIFNLFKNKIKKGDTYAVKAGDFVGQLFTFVEKSGNDYIFLSTPLLEIQKIPKEKVDFAIEQDIIEYIENLPRHIFKVIKAEYKHQSNNNGEHSK
jgi:hypothetical protein